MGVLRIVPVDELGRALKELRVANGVTRKLMVERTGTAAQTFFDIENQKTKWNGNHLQAYAKALGINIQIVIAMSDEDVKRLLNPPKK